MMTKGALGEQAGKVERSGLKEFFAAVEIVAEKDVVSYRSVVAKIRFTRRQYLDDRKQPEVRH